MSITSRKHNFIEPAFLPLGTLVSHNAQRFPDVVAMTTDSRQTSWAQFDRCTNQVANGLLSANVTPGDRIAYLGKTTDEAFHIMHGVAKARCVFTPVNWRLTASEVSYIVEDANPRFLFVSASLFHLVQELLEASTSPMNIVLLDDEQNELSKDRLVFNAWRESFSSEPTGVEPRASDEVMQLYTSGTTGHPKGAVITHEYMINLGKMLHAQDEDVYDMLPGEEYLNFFPVFHTSGAISGQYLTFSRGCGIIILADFDTKKIFEYIDKKAIPMLGGVPTMLQAFLSSPRFLETDFSRVRYVMYGAAPMPIPLRDRLVELVGCRFAQGYGATESVMITLLSPEDHQHESDRLLSVGRPLPGVEIKIVDSKRRELPNGEVGEVVIRSPVMAQAYWNLAEATAAAFEDGWYFTGDGGCLDEDGYLYLKERIKDLIISGGENIYPAEIENLLYAHPAVESAAVVAVPDDKWGEVPIAFIVSKEGSDYNPEALQNYLDQKLARYKRPKYYEQIDALPLNASGKILKKDLRELAKTMYPLDGESSLA